MGWFDLITKIYKALEAGHALEDSRTWANRATLVQSITAILTAVVATSATGGLDLHLQGTDVAAIALGAATLGNAVAGVLHVASNESAGLSSKAKRGV